MRVAHRAHFPGHPDTPIARRQLGLGLLGGVTGVVPDLGLGKTKTNNPNHPTEVTQPPVGTTPAAAVPGTTAPPANGGPTPTGILGGAGGGGNTGGDNTGGDNGGGGSGGGNRVATSPSNAGGTVTSSGTQTRTSGTPSISSGGGTTPTQGATGSGHGFDPGTVNVNIGNGSPDHGLGNGGPSGSTSGTGISGDPSGSSPSGNVNTLSGEKKGTPAGPIAAAVVCTLLLIAVVVFILRKRSRNRRDEHAIKWWFTRNRTSRSYGDDEALNCVGSSSRRSSFATTLDHSKAAFLPDTSIPPPPPMAEVGRANGTDPALVLDIHADRRFSIGSATSHNSHFLVVHHRESLQHENSPSLNSCTESFPFPKPPPGDRRTFYSQSFEESRSGSPKKRESEMPYIASPTTHSPLSNPFADNNPFDDSPTLPTPVTTGTSELETVHSPFIPQLHDELFVNIGDSVRIVQVFDDGWAFVEKMSPIHQGEHGLIPLNCFRNLGQNGLVGGKRMSSQGAKIMIA